MKYSLIILSAFIICSSVSYQFSDIPHKEIAPGVQMPMVGLGTWLYNDTRVEEAVTKALKIGYKFIDTAHDYENAKGIAKALKSSGLKREEYFITTKVEGGLDAEETLKQAQEQLDQLEIGYADLILLHFPFYANGTTFSPEGRAIQWKALESLVQNQKTRSIGVSHFCKSHLSELLKIATIKPALNQVEYHIGMGKADGNATDDKEYCESQGVTYQPFSELCGPCCMGKPDTCTDNMELIDGKMVTDIGAKYNKTGVQVSLKWLVQQNMPIIPKSDNPVHLQQNIDLFDFELSDADMQTLIKSPSPAVCGGGDGVNSGDCSFE